MRRYVCVLTSCLLLGAGANAADVVPGASTRFADESVKEVPDFQKHVLPLMGRAGCNGRACHGSFQGRGGFRLSLFGYDFKMDHEALTAGDSPRVNPEVPPASKILEKATLEIPHEGDKRFEVDSWQYRMLSLWIQDGAKGVTKDGHVLDKITVEPKEILWSNSSEPIPVKVFATWEDGTVEDVTCISRFRTNDESIAEIDEDGVVRIVGKGDTHVVAFYDNGVAVVPVIRPVSELAGANYPKVETPTKIDALVVDKLRKVGIVPSEECTDAEFLRRVSLDISGTLPAPAEVEAFLADSASDKRAKKIDQLLDTPAYAAWWATKLCDIMGNNTRALDPTFRTQQANQWYSWVKSRIAENAPYDKLIEGIVVAQSRKADQSYEDFCKEMVQYNSKGGEEKFAERDTMPHYWTRRTVRTADDKALNFAYTFLGVQLQCAQCHKHPFDQWTQQDFKQFTAFFNRINVAARPRDKEGKEYYDKLMAELGANELKGGEQRRAIQVAARDGQVVPLSELVINAPAKPRVQKKGKKVVTTGRTITPKLLGGEEVLDNDYADPRMALMDWMRHDQNPYFARAWVNRVWASYFGVGIIEPADDQNLANPPSNKPLLDYLAQGFTDNNFDMKWLHREIANSATYQRSWKANDTNVHDTRNFSRAQVRRLPAEVAYDAVKQATVGTQALAQSREELTGRAIALAVVGNGRARDGYALEVFGKPERTTTCDCERSNEVNLVQSIFLRNDQELFNLMNQKDGWLLEVGKQHGLVRDAKQVAATDKEQQNLIGLNKRIDQMEKQLKRARKQSNEKQAEKLEQQLAQARKTHKRLASQLEAAPKRDEKGELVLAQADMKQIVRDAYLRTLSRPPRDEELSRSCEHLQANKGLDGVRDLLWSLINTKEFIVNH